MFKDEDITTESSESAETSAGTPTTEATGVAAATAKIKSSKKKRSKIKIPKGKIFINSTYNNTINRRST